MINEKDGMKFTEFDEGLRKLTLCSSLIELAKISQFLEQKQTVASEFSINKGIQTFKVIVSQWALAFLTYRLVIKSNDFRGHQITVPEIAILNSQYTNLSEPTIDKKDVLLSLLGRLSQEQFWWQGIGMYDFSRAYYLISEVSQKVGCDKKLDLNKIFYDKLNLNILEFLKLGWYVYGRVTKISPCFTKEQMFNHSIESLKELTKEDKIESFLKIVSVTYEGLRELDKKINTSVNEGYEKYSFNPLLKYPIIRLEKKSPCYNNTHYIISNSKAFFKKVCDGVYWELRDIFLKDKSQDFLNYWGYIFEEYVGILLKHYFGVGNVFRLEEKDYSGKKADWIVTTNKSEILVVECKSSLLPFGVRMTFEEKAFQNWIMENFVSGIEQLFSTEDMLINKQLKMKVDIKNKIIHKIIVTYENLHFAESLWKDMIRQYISDAGLATKYPKVSNNFYSMHILEFELLEELLAKYSLKDIIDVKENKQLNFFNAYREISKTKLSNSLLKDIEGKFFTEFIGPE